MDDKTRTCLSVDTAALPPDSTDQPRPMHRKPPIGRSGSAFSAGAECLVPNNHVLAKRFVV